MKTRENLLSKRFSPHRTEHEEYFDSQTMLAHFEKVFSAELFDVGSRPIFTYNVAPGKELRDALSAYLRTFQDRRTAFNGLYLSSECKVEVQVGEKVKVFVKMVKPLSDHDMDKLLNIKQVLEKASGLKMVLSRHHNKIGLLGPNLQEESVPARKEEGAAPVIKFKRGLSV